jgi:hypothetical protein
MNIFLGLLVLFISFRQFRAQRNAKILINKIGITLNDAFYNWNDIYETAILEKSRSAYLTVILKENASYRLYRLTNFRVIDIFFPITLSKYVEHFKTTASNADS